MKILFYDSSCIFCSYWVGKIYKWDKKKRLFFAPLEGQTAKEKFKEKLPLLIKADTIIFLDDKGKHYLRSKAIFKAMWSIGGFFKVIGLLSFLPTLPFDIIYCFIAKNRKAISCHIDSKSLDKDNQRFLF